MTWLIPFETERFELPVEHHIFVEQMRLATGDNQNPLVKKVTYRNLLRGYTLRTSSTGFRIIAKRTNRKPWSGRIFATFLNNEKVRFWYRPSAFSILNVTMLWFVLAIAALLAYFNYDVNGQISFLGIGFVGVGLIFQLYQLNRIFKQIQLMKNTVRTVVKGLRR